MSIHKGVRTACRFYARRLFSFRFMTVLLVQFVTLLYYLAPVRQMAALSGKTIAPFALPMVTSESFYVLLWITGVIVMVCDVPLSSNTSTSDTICINRFFSSVGFIIVLSAIYLISTFVLSVLCCLPYASIMNEWGFIWKHLALGQSTTDLSFDVSPMILSEQYGWSTMIKSTTLLFGCSCFVGATCYLGNLVTNRKAGSLFAVIVSLLDVTLYNLVLFGWFKYSPLTLAQWGFYWYGTSSTGVSISYGYAFLWGGSLLLFAICFLLERISFHCKKQKDHGGCEVSA